MAETTADCSWNALSVRTELPDIMVTYPDGRTELRPIVGRCSAFAIVILGVGTVEVAWDTVAHCLNAGKPVIL